MSETTYNYFEAYWEAQRPEASLFSTWGFIAMVTCVINSALPEAEVLLSGGRCPIPTGVIKIVCFGLLVGLALLYGRLDFSAFPTGMWVVAMLFLALDFPFLLIWQDKPLGDLAFSYNATFCPLIFAPFACALRGKVPERLSLKIIVLVFLICALVGSVQFIFQVPVVQTASSDGNFRIYASWWMQEGQSMIRAFSIFGSSLEYGNFAVIIAGIGIGMCGRPGGWIKGVPLYLLAAACCYTTLTRVVFLELLFATIAALTFTFGRSLRRVVWQPIVGFVVGGGIAFSGLSEITNQSQTLYNSGSLNVRLLQWEVFGLELLHSTRWEQLFGLGYCEADKPLIVPVKDQLRGKAGAALVDNLYLALTLHIGLVGMLIIIALLWAMWRHLRVETIKHPTPMLIGIASFWSTFLLTGMFNVEPALFGFWFLIATMFFQASRYDDWAVPWANQLQQLALQQQTASAVPSEGDPSACA
jgi:hypothetical protein